MTKWAYNRGREWLRVNKGGESGIIDLVKLYLRALKDKEGEIY